MFSSEWRRGTIVGLAAAGAALVIGAGALGVTWANGAARARPAASQAAPGQHAAAQVAARRSAAPPAAAERTTAAQVVAAR